jgi:hypothetical protein
MCRHPVPTHRYTLRAGTPLWCLPPSHNQCCGMVHGQGCCSVAAITSGLPCAPQRCGTRDRHEEAARWVSVSMCCWVPTAVCDGVSESGAPVYIAGEGVLCQGAAGPRRPGHAAFGHLATLPLQQLVANLQGARPYGCLNPPEQLWNVSCKKVGPIPGTGFVSANAVLSRGPCQHSVHHVQPGKCWVVCMYICMHLMCHHGCCEPGWWTRLMAEPFGLGQLTVCMSRPHDD